MRALSLRVVLGLSALAFALIAVSPEAQAAGPRGRGYGGYRGNVGYRNYSYRPNYNAGYRNYGYRPNYAYNRGYGYGYGFGGMNNFYNYNNYNGFGNYGTPVVGGTYVPGFGVTGGLPGAMPVVGGTYAPGFGVIGNAGTPVVGGTYIPGYGVR